MKRALWLGLFAGAALLARPAFSEDGKTDAAGDAKARHAALFEKLDTNHDGVLTPDEVPQEQRRLFQRLLRQAGRTNEDKLTRDQFIAALSDDRVPADGGDKAGPARSQQAGEPGAKGPGPEGGPPGMPGPRMLMGLALLHALDTNGDGQIDAKELAAAESSLRKLDKNGDGIISREELLEAARELRPGIAAGLAGAPGGGEFNADAAFKRMLALYDKNGDGKLQKDELPERLQARFEELDTNHDGFLDQSELKDVLRRFEARAAGLGEGAKGRPGATGTRGVGPQ
jgi:Ca2+-binding EF-hand superfamily protein